MKHWDGRDRGDAIELRVARREPPRTGSVLGLALSLALLAGLAWALAPDGPVSSELAD